MVLTMYYEQQTRVVLPRLVNATAAVSLCAALSTTEGVRMTYC